MTSSGELKIINLKPGITKNDTTYQAEGTWTSAQMVRFQHGNAKKMGGYVSLATTETYRGIARDSIAWNDLEGVNFYGLGTNSELAVFKETSYYDITPVAASLALTSAFSTINGSSIFRVATGTPSGSNGDYIAITSVNIANAVVRGPYAIVSAGASFVDFDAVTTANATTVSNGTAFTLHFLISTGRISSGATGGWGSGPWGGSGGGWGAGVTTLGTQLRTWTLDNWGEDLLANYRGGGIYLWDRTTGTGVRAAQISGAPTKANSIAVIDPPRILCVYGTSAYLGNFDPLLVRWSSNEDYSQFSPAVTNASGELRLQDGNEIMRAVVSKNETLIFTDTAVYSQQYIGGDYIFSIQKVGSNCGAIGPQSAIDVNGTVYWMSTNGFYMYNGQVQKMDCTVYDNIFSKSFGDGLNFDQQFKVHTGVNAEFSEIIWLYPSRSSEENNRYVIYNFVEGVWYDGILPRTTWIDASVYERPITTGVSTDTFFQEVGFDANGAELPALLQSAYFDLDEGNNMLLADQYIPDYKNTSGTPKVRFAFKKFPDAQEEFVKGPFDMTDKQVLSFRGRGRQMEITHTVSGVGGYFQLGRFRIRLKEDGKR